jgi:hypothetical protein
MISRILSELAAGGYIEVSGVAERAEARFS